ncbi:MAG: hypothetical protein N2515_02005 [Deltaproteobacteria bacterium]|nr:hypothetical protein [Deltaproteobacteria bacterium]
MSGGFLALGLKGVTIKRIRPIGCRRVCQGAFGRETNAGDEFLATASPSSR